MMDLLGRKKWGNSKNQGHNFLELAYVLSGTVIHQLNGTETTIKEGDYFIIDYNAQHGYRPIGEKNILNSLSHKLKFSAPYLSRRFKEDTGMVFSEYLQKVRIEESLRLLANTDKKTADIAESVGYNDIKFFYSVFKRYVKLTPGEFKKQNRR